MPERICQRPGCGRPIPSRKRQDARWCSRSCESKARRPAKRKADFEAANPGAAELLGAEDRSLAELHERATAPAHWADLEARRVDDGLAEFSDRYDVGVYEDQDDGHGRTVLDSIQGQDTAEGIRRLRADVASRLEQALRKYEHTIRVNYQGSYELGAQRDPRVRWGRVRSFPRDDPRRQVVARREATRAQAPSRQGVTSSDVDNRPSY